MASEVDDSFTSFPLSHSLPNSPLSPPEDATFSILPRYLLQKVKNTFGSGLSDNNNGGVSRPSSSRNNSGTSSINNAATSSSSAAKRPVNKGVSPTRAPADIHNDGSSNAGPARRQQGSPATTGPAAARSSSRNHHYSLGTVQPRIASIRDEAGSSVSRSSPRLSVVGTSRRTLPPLLSRPHQDAVFHHQSGTTPPQLGIITASGGGGVSRSHSQSLSTLPESAMDYSPPPPYSATPHTPMNTIPGFPINRDGNDDAKSISSVAASNLGVTQIFRRLRGEALSRDYWMADEAAVDCYDCNTTFTTWRRKHHCRVCGRIFCSRCASNVIPGARFGHEGLVRVCNICLAILTHRSNHRGPSNDQNNSDRSGLPASSSVANMNISLPLQSSYRAGQSQFTASALFPRSDYSGYNLSHNMSVDDLAALQRRDRRFSDASFARPETPDLLDESVSPRPALVTLGSPLHFIEGKAVASIASSAGSPSLPAITPAPFRKTTADEDRPLPSPQPPTPEDVSDEVFETSPRKLGVEGLGISDPSTPLPVSSPMYQSGGPGTGEGSCEGSAGGPLASSTGRPTTPSAASYLQQTISLPYVRSRLNSRAADQIFELADIDDTLLANPSYFDSLLRVHENYTNLSTDINFHKIAIDHIRHLLRQCLQHAQVLNPATWEDVLLKLLIKVAKGPRPRVQEGDSMDVRHYVKIKRVPGGTPKDCEYINGAVFTKSILNKNLPRLLSNPRVMLFDYAFEFEQGETRMSRLDSLRESEKDSLRKLTNSVIDHRPHIVLVGQSVSGLALEYLHKANIIVARNVKPSALHSVARCTQAGIFDTYQFFPDTTRLGRCTVFRAQTLVHKLIPGGRKTLMRFEGCNKDLGATILLRGGDMQTLSKIKRLMRFMTLAAYSVRLELQYLWDAQASLAPELDLPRLRELPDKRSELEYMTEEDEEETKAEHNREGSNDNTMKRLLKQRETARIINQALKPYTARILSTSPTVIFPPPHSLERLRLDNMKISKLRSHHRQERTVTGPTVSAGSNVMPNSHLVSKSGEPDAALHTSAALNRSLSEVSLLSVKPQSRTRALQISAQLAEESQIQEAEVRRDEHLQLWENRLARQQDDLNPMSHQHLSVLRTVICQTTTRICDGPRILQQHYYRDGSDQTLRQFIETMILSAPYKCQAKGCDKVMLSHYTTYAHGQKRMHVVIEPHLMPPGSEEEILVWSYCRLCELKTMPTTLSQEASDFSFGKYLELSFYSEHLSTRALPCDHNLHSDHVRFLCWRNVALRVMVDPIDVSDVIVPPLRLRVDAWTQLRIKNEEYRAIQKSTTAYWDSVLHRIHSFNPELLPVDRLEAGQQALIAFEERAVKDQRHFENLLDQAYENAPISQPSALNSVRVALQAKVVSWETEFINFEQTYIPSESEKARRATSSHLRRLFSDPNGSVPQSPDLRMSFSPMPSVPPSPSLPPSERSEQTSTATVSPETSTRSLLSLAAKSAPLSPTLSNSSEGLPTESDVPEIPSFQLTEENVSQHNEVLLPATSQGPLSLAEGSPTVEHGKPNADGDDRSDSDSTVCADPPRRTLSFAPQVEEHPSESEDALMLRPYRSKRARTGPSIASLVTRFEEEQIPPLPESNRTGVPRPATSTPPPSRLPVRPGLKRGKSDYTEVRSQRARQVGGSNEPVLSDGDLPALVNTSRTSSSLRSPNRSTRPRSPNPARKRPPLASIPTASTSSSRTSSNLTVPGSRAAKLSSQTSISSRGHEKRSSQDMALSSDTSGMKGSRGLEFRLPAGAMRLGSSRPSPLLLPKAQKRPPALLPSATQGNRVSTMTKHFNYLSRQAEKERQKQVVLARQRRARPVAVPKTSVDIFVSSKDALKEDSDDDGSSSGADDEMDGDDDDDKLDGVKAVASQGNESDTGILDLAKVDQYLRDHQASLPDSQMSASVGTEISVSSSESSAGADPTTVGTGTESGPSVPVSPYIGMKTAPATSRYGNLSESEMSSTGTDRQLSLMKTLSSLWNYRGAEFTPLELPQSKLEHFEAGNRIVVREDEPSSVIAHGLESQLYKDLMKESHGYSVATSSEIFMPESELGHGVNKSSNWDVLDFHTDGGTDLEEVMKKPTDRHLRLAWDDTTLRYTIRVFFADQFDALRKNSGCQELFIESLARCHKWDAQGGKSGSAFLKTKDDRFIIKEISPAEMTALLDFAPRYFQYLSKAYFDDLPTVLAKILGVFRISFKSQSSGRSKRMDVLVMENIYYNKTITDQFDLKGSLRNRMVETSTGKGCVLLDENLIQMSYDKPFYIREHTKKHLETALFNDSLFLANQKIMDYSLIVGVDRTSTELVVGIVDFLRPYTWDKRLETWVKETAYIGAGTREPTVLNPRIYKTRFREAMSRYFLLVPDRWTSAEAIQTGQPAPSAGPSAPATKSKSTQVAPGQDEQQEQFAGGLSRVHSPTLTRRLVPMAG